MWPRLCEVQHWLVAAVVARGCWPMRVLGSPLALPFSLRVQSPPGLHTNLHLKYLELQNKYLSFQQFGVWINNMERLCQKDTLRFSVVMLCGRVLNIMAFCCRFWVTRNVTGFWKKKKPLTNSTRRHRGHYPCICIKCNCCNKHHLSHELSSMVLLPLQK